MEFEYVNKINKNKTCLEGVKLLPYNYLELD